MKKFAVQYYGTLLSFFNKRSRNHWDAEDLTQEVFCKIMKHTNGQVAVNDYAEPYLYSVAWSVLRDRSRRDRVRQRDMHVVYDEAVEKEDPLSPEQTLYGEELYARFLEALKDLSPKTRGVFLLNRYDGLTSRQIAIHLDISVSAVEKHMMKALARVKQIVKEQ